MANWRVISLGLCVLTLLQADCGMSETDPGGASADHSRTECGTFRHAGMLREAMTSMDVMDAAQCKGLGLEGRLRIATRDVLIFAGRVSEHCIATMHRLNSPGTGTVPITVAPIDDEDAGLESSGEKEEMEVCNLYSSQTKLQTQAPAQQRPQMAHMASMGPPGLRGLLPPPPPPPTPYSTGPSVRMLESVLESSAEMLQYLRSASDPLRSPALKRRLDELEMHKHTLDNVTRILGVVEGFQVQLARMRMFLTPLNASKVEHLVCHYAFPKCSQGNQPLPWLPRTDRACHRWKASQVLLHPLPQIVSLQLSKTFLAGFMREQCSHLEQTTVGAKSSSIAACYTQTPGVCNGRPVYKCPGHLQMTDNPEHWVVPIYFLLLRAYTGALPMMPVNSSSTSTAMASCSFPCGLRCRNSDAISDAQVVVLKRLRTVSFFLLLFGCVVAVVVAVQYRHIALQYPQRNSLVMMFVFLLWSLHYLPAALVDTEPLLCHSDRTARMIGTYAESGLCRFTFITFYGVHIVNQCLAVFSRIIIWLMARDLNPMRSPIFPSDKSKRLITAEIASVFLSFLFGGIAAGVVLHRKNVFPLISAGYCTVFKDDAKAGVMVPLGIALALQTIFLLAIIYEMFRERRRARKMQRYSVNRPSSSSVDGGIDPATTVRRAVRAAVVHHLWSMVAFVYIMFSVREGERPVLPAFISAFECTLATCGAPSCPPSSQTSPHFFGIVVAFICVLGVFGIAFPTVVMASSRGSVADSRRRGQSSKSGYEPVKVVTTKQLSEVMLASPSVDDQMMSPP